MIREKWGGERWLTRISLGFVEHLEAWLRRWPSSWDLLAISKSPFLAQTGPHASPAIWSWKSRKDFALFFSTFSVLLPHFWKQKPRTNENHGLALQPILVSNLLTTCFSFPSAGVISMQHHTQLYIHGSLYSKAIAPKSHTASSEIVCNAGPRTDTHIFPKSHFWKT